MKYGEVSSENVLLTELLKYAEEDFVNRVAKSTTHLLDTKRKLQSRNIYLISKRKWDYKQLVKTITLLSNIWKMFSKDFANIFEIPRIMMHSKLFNIK